jgi:hypothetical protein
VFKISKVSLEMMKMGERVHEARVGSRGFTNDVSNRRQVRISEITCMSCHVKIYTRECFVSLPIIVSLLLTR